MHDLSHPNSPRLEHCPEGLPRAAYLDGDWYAREMATIFARQWVMVGRLADYAPGSLRRALVGQAEVIVARGDDGSLAAYHNSCPHRGSELCEKDAQPLGKLIRCPYHAWSFAAADGRLVSTGHAVPTADFDRHSHGLRKVAHRVWAGFVFLNLSPTPPEIFADQPLDHLAHWPMESLVTGHRWQVEMDCNWKGFWENYSECLHCPGIHPELCDRVPIYAKGIMGASEALDYQPSAAPLGNLKPGTETWTMDGTACGPVFPDLTEAERAEGYHFITLWPSAYVVAHVDYVRSVRLVPLGPEKTRLIAEWHFSAETLAQPGFDAAEVARFAKIVMEQDGAASEMNHRGIRSPSFKAARLMPEEYEIHRFHSWVLHELEGVE
ncbi:aromatic ring-hydroxylating dioxygenase subunit alpha [Xinfangfangia sp. CPCC 101601]|uniref:Aromatic ring-hydroxylating dioxygenase subunit alpha n=1 Tax=Pseudogemmobacter lacusdianii TaxID=3069608 RepID=A0ABU0VSQ9_9RHOB|nr:aromatic ring-hydroxylating dioxygenase subunit alpha [Xinfangfangia sp. CPCC 101601]MDQ2064769.1 aromatic ring-hydroxylating dioxygenase subunit alpha [Xinfangfangia sp. CPCC 101601]